MRTNKLTRLRSGNAAILALFFVLLTTAFLSWGLRGAEAADGDFVIFDNSLADEWELDAVRTRARLNNSSPVYDGNRSLLVEFRQGAAYLTLRTGAPVFTGSFEALRLAVYGSNDRVGDVAVTAIDGLGNAGSGAVIVDIPARQWSLVEIPLSQLGNPAVIGGIRFDKTGGPAAWSAFYLDTIALVANNGEPTSDDPAETNTPPTATATASPVVLPTATPVQPLPTATQPLPSATEPLPTNTPRPTNTLPAPTATPVQPTATQPPAPTAVPPTPTALPPAATSAPSQPPSPSAGIWISPAEIAALPTSGRGWEAVLGWAQQSSSSPNISDQNDQTDAVVVAKALVYARTGDNAYREQVVAAIHRAMGTEDGGNALALSRNLAGYVIAADLIGLSGADDQAFRAWLSAVRQKNLDGRTLISTHEVRPNNWGTHAGASRIAAAIYLGDTQDLQRAAAVFRGWLGDRSAYAGFSYGELDWQANPSQPVGVNPAGATIQGHNVDGVLPDDQRRSGGFTWPPPQENYTWEALQGVVAQARMLSRQGFDAFSWSDRAILRAVIWLHEQASFPATGDDGGTPWLVNGVYGTGFPAPNNARPGKNGLGWYEWFYQR